MASRSSSKFVIYVALVGNLLVAATKFLAAGMTGSSSMLSEAVHSLVDTGNEVLLLYGYRQSGRDPDIHHPLGYGREIYFWSFVVALLLFVVGACVSIYQGIMHILSPVPIEDVHVNFIVLGLSFLFEGATWLVALKAFQRAKGDVSYYQAIRRSKDPPSFMVLLEDTAALIGITIAAGGIFLADKYQMPLIDGVASLLIGGVLAITASVLARESKELLIGERAGDRINASIALLAQNEAGVEGVNDIFTLHLAPDQIVAALSLEFADDMRTPQIEATVVSLERKLRKAHPELVSLFIKPQTRQTFENVNLFTPGRRNGWPPS